MSLTSFSIAEIGYDEHDYGAWLATLTQASERLDVLQTVVDEVRDLCEHEDALQTREVMAVLNKHGVTT